MYRLYDIRSLLSDRTGINTLKITGFVSLVIKLDYNSLTFCVNKYKKVESVEDLINLSLPTLSITDTKHFPFP